MFHHLLASSHENWAGDSSLHLFKVYGKLIKVTNQKDDLKIENGLAYQGKGSGEG